ncbi:MAG: hypothetical protein WBY88_11785, partial [Desulfosarcina sp.]
MDKLVTVWFLSNAMGNNKVQWERHLNPTRFWIIGAGHFGRLAAERIIDRIPRAAVTVVDQRPFTIQGSGIVSQMCDGIQWLDKMLTQDAAVDMIVPAIPVHVLAEWLKCKLNKSFDIKSIEIPDDWLSRMPHP